MKEIRSDIFTEKKKEWGVGPWTDEPDCIYWEQDGIYCMVNRNYFGNLCGYIAFHHSDFPDYNFENMMEVHGGITFDRSKEELSDIFGLCDYDLSDKRMIGFDCGHWNDMQPETISYYKNFQNIPGMAGSFKFMMDEMETKTYRTVDYVKSEIQKMLKQLPFEGHDE